MMHAEIEGLDVAGALVGPYGGDLAAALIGCSFFPNASDVEDHVVTCAASATTKITIKRPSAPPALVDVAIGSVLPSDQVVEIVRAHRDRLDAPYPADVKTIEAAGIVAEFNRPDAVALANIFRGTGLPSLNERYAAFRAMARHGMDELLERLVRHWASLADTPVQIDLVIQFSPFQRKDGNYEEAVTALNRGIESPYKSPFQHLIMLTERAAVLLDLYDKTGDREFLITARQSHDEAAALAIESKHLARARKRLEDRER